MMFSINFIIFKNDCKNVKNLNNVTLELINTGNKIKIYE